VANRIKSPVSRSVCEPSIEVSRAIGAYGFARRAPEFVAQARVLFRKVGFGFATVVARLVDRPVAEPTLKRVWPVAGSSTAWRSTAGVHFPSKRHPSKRDRSMRDM